MHPNRLTRTVQCVSFFSVLLRTVLRRINANIIKTSFFRNSVRATRAVDYLPEYMCVFESAVWADMGFCMRDGKQIVFFQARLLSKALGHALEPPKLGIYKKGLLPLP